jgi:hypothetical protein
MIGGPRKSISSTFTSESHRDLHFRLLELAGNLGINCILADSWPIITSNQCARFMDCAELKVFDVDVDH